MNIFASLQKYAEGFDVKDVRPFNAEELSGIKSAKVVPSQYGLSCCFSMVSGCKQYIPLSRDTIAQAGDIVDVNTVKVLTLQKGDEDVIYRVEF